MKHRVLVVDDEPEVAQTIKMFLEHSGGYEAKILLDAKNIVQEMHVFHPDLIIMDLLMPDVGGLEACEMLDKDSLGLVTPIIILSGIDKEVDKVRAFKLGVVDYVVKPISRQDLMRVVDKAVSSKTQN